jgi:hypothetical protein
LDRAERDAAAVPTLRERLSAAVEALETIANDPDGDGMAGLLARGTLESMAA